MPGHILIVDDLLLGRMLLRAKLAVTCHASIVAGTGQQALEMAQQDPPGVIVVSSHLPDMEGAEFCRQLRALPVAAHVPLIMLCATPSPEQRIEALGAGADDVIGKPVAESYLLSRIRALLRHNASEQVLVDLTAPILSQTLSVAAAECNRPRRVALVSTSAVAANSRTALIQGLAPTLYDRHLGLSDLLGDTSGPQESDVLLLAPEILEKYGPHVIADLRARFVTSHLPIVVMLDSESGFSAASLLDLGAEDIWPLPLDPEEARLRLAAIIHRKRRQTVIRSAIGAALDQASRDPLTGLFNRRHAMSRLVELITRQDDAPAEGFAILLLDMDNFKNVNDSFGHIAGDDVLIEAARRMRDTLGPRDHLARFGGEEFLLILPGADIDQARILAERLRHQIEGAPFALPLQGAALHVTASIGVAVYDPEQTTAQTSMLERIRTLVDSADQAMRLSKSRGRNCVSVTTRAFA